MIYLFGVVLYLVVFWINKHVKNIISLSNSLPVSPKSVIASCLKKSLVFWFVTPCNLTFPRGMPLASSRSKSNLRKPGKWGTGILQFMEHMCFKRSFRGRYCLNWTSLSFLPLPQMISKQFASEWVPKLQVLHPVCSTCNQTGLIAVTQTNI